MDNFIRRAGLPNPSDNLKRMEANSRTIGKIIGDQCPKGWGFALMFFQFEGKESTWMSNAQRGDMVKYLREMADKLELDQAGGPVAPFSH